MIFSLQFFQSESFLLSPKPHRYSPVTSIRRSRPFFHEMGNQHSFHLKLVENAKRHYFAAGRFFVRSTGHGLCVCLRAVVGFREPIKPPRKPNEARRLKKGCFMNTQYTVPNHPYPPCFGFVPGALTSILHVSFNTKLKLVQYQLHLLPLSTEKNK